MVDCTLLPVLILLSIQHLRSYLSYTLIAVMHMLIQLILWSFVVLGFTGRIRTNHCGRARMFASRIAVSGSQTLCTLCQSDTTFCLIPSEVFVVTTISIRAHQSCRQQGDEGRAGSAAQECLSASTLWMVRASRDYEGRHLVQSYVLATALTQATCRV